LERCIADDPDDLYRRFKLLEQASFWNDRALWQSAAAQTAPRLAGADLSRLHFAGPLVTLTALGLHPGDPQKALQLLDSFAARLDPSPTFHLRRGELRERLGDLVGARADFERCRSLAHSRELALTGNRQLAGVRPLVGL